MAHMGKMPGINYFERFLVDYFTEGLAAALPPIGRWLCIAETTWCKLSKDLL
jgi:hypothetical protein